MNDSRQRQVVRTWSRRSTVIPEMVGHTIGVHNGRKFIPVFIPAIGRPRPKKLAVLLRRPRGRQRLRRRNPKVGYFNGDALQEHSELS